MKDKLILAIFSIIGFILLPFALKKEPQKDWIIVFLVKNLVSSYLGKLVVAKKWLEFPVRLLPKISKSSILFDNLLFPLLCVFYNQTTYKSKMGNIILQSFIYSLPMTIIEIFLEKKTNLIKYHKWKWYHTLFSLVGTFLFVRGVLGYIRRIT